MQLTPIVNILYYASSAALLPWQFALPPSYIPYLYTNDTEIFTAKSTFSRIYTFSYYSCFHCLWGIFKNIFLYLWLFDLQLFNLIRHEYTKKSVEYGDQILNFDILLGYICITKSFFIIHTTLKADLSPKWSCNHDGTQVLC